MASVEIRVRSNLQGNVTADHEDVRDYTIGEDGMETVKEVLAYTVRMVCKAYNIDPKELLK